MTRDVTQIKNEPQGGEFIATREELQAIDAAISAVDAGDIATDAEIKAAFEKFRSA
jgi:hypothetical protein